MKRIEKLKKLLKRAEAEERRARNCATRAETLAKKYGRREEVANSRLSGAEQARDALEERLALLELQGRRDRA